MKKYFISIAIGFVLLLTLISPAIANQNVQAQAGGPGTCFDASGAPIPCPPTDEPEEEDNQPTKTPLPLTNPTQETITADWSQTCKKGDASKDGSAQLACVLALTIKCLREGGTADGTEAPNGDQTISCNLLVIEPTPLSITNPTQGADTAGATWSGTCKGATIQETTTCIGQFTNGCGHVGGSTSSTVNDDGSVDLTCTVPLILPTPDPGSQITAPEFPLPDDGFLGTCTSDNLSECLDRYKCEDGLLVIKIDLYAPGGTKYDFYCIPHETVPQLDLPITIPSDDTGTAGWVGWCNAGDLDSCLDLAASDCAAEGGEYSEWYDDDGSAGVYCQNESGTQVLPTQAPPVAAAPPTGGGGPGWLPWIAGGVIGILIGMLVPAIQKVRAIPNDESSGGVHVSEVVVTKNKPNESRMPQIKEHILLSKDDPSASKPKPTPPPPPKPSGGTKGDFNSDADVDGSDFNL